MNDQNNTTSNADLKVINGVPMMGSRGIAEVTGKKPAHVVRDIESMLESLGKHYPEVDDYDSYEFSIRRKVYNGRMVIDEIWLNETLSMTLVTGYDACRRLALVEQWQQMKLELSQPRLAAQPATREISMNNDLLSLARVVAEATASATMKAVIDVAGLQAIQKPVVAQPAVITSQPATASVTAEAVHDDSDIDQAEFVPVSDLAWACGFSDAACRRIATFAKLKTCLSNGDRGRLLIHRETFISAAQALLDGSTPPAGKRQRWQHPEFGGFTLRLKSSSQAKGDE